MLRLLVLCLFWSGIVPIEASTIQCGETVTGWYHGNGEEVIYRYQANSFTSIQPTTCGLSWWDTHVEVRTTSVGFSSITKLTLHQPSKVLAMSDDLGPIICPLHPAASAVTIKVNAGVTYDVVLRGGSNYAGMHGNETAPLAYSMHLFCSEPLENYWAHMFAEVGFHDDHLLSVFDGVWYYNHTSTCVGKGQFYGLCPFHFVHCAGHLTYGWGVLQAQAVLMAIDQPGHRYPNQTCSMTDLPCSEAEYTCLNLQCIDSDSLCDGHDDCLDGEPFADDYVGDNYVDSNATAVTSSDEEHELCVSADFGCMDTSALNFNPLAVANDGTCYYCSWDAPVPLGLVLDDKPVLLEEGCGVFGANLRLAVRASQQYEVTQVSLYVPATREHHFLAEFIHGGRVNSLGDAWQASNSSELPCWNDYTATIPWSELTLGNSTDGSTLIHYEYPGQVVLVGFVAVDSMEIIDNVRNTTITRWVRTTLPFHIVYRTNVMTHVSPNMLEWKVEDALTEATYADIWVIEQSTVIVYVAPHSLHVKAQIVLLTKVDRPLVLRHASVSVDSPALQTAAANLTISLFEDCSPRSKVCAQQFLVEVNLVDACHFSGAYTANFSVECGTEDSANCHVPDNATETVTFVVESESVCPQVLQEVVAVGSSTAYREARNGTALRNTDETVFGSDAFVSGEWAYYEVALSSIDGFIVETSIDTIDLCFSISCSPPRQLYNRSSAANGVDLVPEVQLRVFDYPRGIDGLDSPLPNISDIHIYLSPDVFEVPSTDMTLAFQLRVKVSVVYYHTNFVLDLLSLPTGDEADDLQHSKVLLQASEYPNAKDRGFHALRQAQHGKSLESMRHKIDLQQLFNFSLTPPDFGGLSVHVNGEVTSNSPRSADPPSDEDDGQDSTAAAAAGAVDNRRRNVIIYIVIAVVGAVVVAVVLIAIYMKLSGAVASGGAPAAPDASDPVNRVLDFSDDTKQD